MQLNGRSVLLTGASSGLGPYLARRLRAAGARLLLTSRRRDPIESLAAELGDSRAIPADLGRRGEAQRLLAEAGEVDVLVSNAGVPGSGRLDDLSIEQIDRVLDVNLRAGIVLARLLLPGMLARRSGHLLFMASMAGHVAGPRTSLYNASKFGLRGFALALRLELAGSGVGVSLVSPTYVSEAGMWAETGQKAGPLVGEVSPGQVAEAVLSAIERNRREIQVAPRTSVVGARVGNFFPGLLERVSRGAAEHPEEAVDKQRHKR